RDALLLDNRRDDEDVVRGQVLLPRIREIQMRPGALERLELLADELLAGRGLRERIGGWEEEALERLGPAEALERGRKLHRRYRSQVRLRREPRRDLALRLSDLVDRRDPGGHIPDREALREDDVEHLLRGRAGRRRRRRR